MEVEDLCEKITIHEPLKKTVMKLPLKKYASSANYGWVIIDGKLLL
jgi:hypothetical protein